MYETTELDHWGPTEWPDWSKWSTLKNVDDQFWTNRTGPFHLTSNRRFRNLGLNGKRPSISMAAWIQAVKGCCGCARVDGLKEDLFWFALSLLFYLTFSTRLPSLHQHVIVQQYMVVVAALDWVENQFWFDFVLILFQFLYLSFNSQWKRKIVTNKMKIIKNVKPEPTRYLTNSRWVFLCKICILDFDFVVELIVNLLFPFA